MTTQEILNTRNEKGIISISNDSAGWSAISRDGMHHIFFYADEENAKDLFYKNENSFAKRICGLLKRGY